MKIQVVHQSVICFKVMIISLVHERDDRGLLSVVYNEERWKDLNIPPSAPDDPSWKVLLCQDTVGWGWRGSLIGHSSVEQYMFEEDHIYISSGLFSIDLCMPNWPALGSGSRQHYPVLSPVMQAVELHFPHHGAQVGKSSQADIIGPGDSWKWGLRCS